MDFSQDLVAQLSQPAAYPDEQPDRVEVIETHISWVFLTDAYAYKVKKPVRTPFLDYSTLPLREQFCREELRLDRRYAPELYLAVVPVTLEHDHLRMGGTGQACEYAVKMRRFPSDALLIRRLQDNRIQPAEIEQLAMRIANFHRFAAHVPVACATPEALDWASELYGTAESIKRDAFENLDALEAASNLSQADQQTLARLRSWTIASFRANEERFEQRRQAGFVRECHGDLHTGNVVCWNGQLTPFDGVEFNVRFRWIDVLSDLAFLAMDLSFCDRPDLAYWLISCYLEQTGDYQALGLLKWYEVYRALVRAKVAGIVMSQHASGSRVFKNAQRERSQLLAVALRHTHTLPPTLWITHGLSGSGKSTGAAAVVQREAAIRVRADVERKRLFGASADFRPDPRETQELYSSSMTRRTYQRLCELAREILAAGYSVVVDATFLKRAQRAQFFQLAGDLHLPLRILNFQADRPTLRQRLIDRRAAGGDASDADVAVLDMQIASLEPLEPQEVSCSQLCHPSSSEND